MENVVESYSTLAGLRNARVSELKQIKHVGETTAENILRELS
jgi:DNA integrity scanning protein DisA with diadenylate cyclase activity